MNNHLSVCLRLDVSIDTSEGNGNKLIALSEQVGTDNGHNSNVLTDHWVHRADGTRDSVFEFLRERAVSKSNGFNHLTVLHCDDSSALLLLAVLNCTCDNNDFRVGCRDDFIDFNTVECDGVNCIASGKQCDTSNGDFSASLTNNWFNRGNGAVRERSDCGDLHTGITSHDNVASFRSFGSWSNVGTNNQSFSISLIADYLRNNTSQGDGHNFRSSSEELVTVDGNNGGTLSCVWADAGNVAGAKVFKGILLGNS